MSFVNLEGLRAVDPNTGCLNIIIESPKNERNKFKYDPQRGLFMLGKVLPAGAVFPFDFGFIPSTLGEDGDPMDVLVLMDAPVFTGCLLEGRLIGVIEAEQTERDGEKMRNDRLIAVATQSHTHGKLKSLKDVDETFVDQIEYFFVSYNKIAGKTFKPTGRFGPDRAQKLVDEGVRRFDKTS